MSLPHHGDVLQILIGYTITIELITGVLQQPFSIPFLCCTEEKKISQQKLTEKVVLFIAN